MFQIVNHHKKLQTLRSPPGPLCSLILVTLSTLCLELFSVCSQLSKCFLCVWSKWLPQNRKSSYVFYICPKLFLYLSTPREHWLSTGHLAFPEVFSQLWEHWAWRERICGSGSSLAPPNPPVPLQPKIQVLKLVSALETASPPSVIIYENSVTLPHFSVSVPPGSLPFISGLLAPSFLIIKCTNFDHLSNGHTSPPVILASNYLSSSLAWL